MKSIKLALIAAGMIVSASAFSQTETKDSTAAQSTTQQPATATEPTHLLVTPNFGPHYIAVLGNYTSSPETATAEKNVTISGDEENPGRVWIEGLTDTKIYALRKEMAGTYKIPAQKIDDKTVPEGTLIYDDNSKHIDICLGCKYKDASPADAFASTSTSATTDTHSKKKKTIAAPKVINFSGSKTNAGTASN